MNGERYITGASPAELKERVPRVDQRLRIAFKSTILLIEDGVNAISDLVKPSHRHHDENRMQYVNRRNIERLQAMEREIGIYVLDKGFGTEETRRIIEFRQRPRI